MNKIFRWCLALTLMLNANILTADTDCKLIFNRKLIDLDIKSNKGWNRVCYNNKIERYLKYNTTKIKQDEICKCLYTRYKLEVEIDKGAFDEN